MKNQIKVVVKTISELYKPNGKLLRNDMWKSISNTKTFFQKCFKDLECDNCKEKSKGKVFFYLSDSGESCIMDYDFNDFCCDDFMIKTIETPC